MYNLLYIQHKIGNMKKKNVLYILSNGRVAAINKQNGEIAWEVKLKSYVKSGMLSSIGQLSLEGERLYVGVGGILLCLSAKDGSLVWVNELKGWGYNFVSIANAGSEAAGAASAAAGAQAATTAAVVAATA